MTREDYRGVRDAFAPPGQQPHAAAAPRRAPTQLPESAPPKSPTPEPSLPLLEDDGASWAAAPGDGAAKTATGGSLVILATGVVAVNQVTVEGHRWIRQSDRVLFLGADPVTEHWIGTLNDSVESLNGLDTADEIVERLLDHVRAGLAVCLAYHGHSALSAQVVQQAVVVSAAENLPAAILPGVSLLDCLFAELGLDPLRHGCQIFNAERFVEQRRRADPSLALIVWLSEDMACAELLELLRAGYGAGHEAVLYEPARYAIVEPVVRRRPIGSLGEGDFGGVSILYIPPKGADD